MLKYKGYILKQDGIWCELYKDKVLVKNRLEVFILKDWSEQNLKRIIEDRIKIDNEIEQFKLKL